MPQYTFSSQFTTNFEYSQAESCGNHNLCILFLHGLCSDPWGRKGDSIKAYAKEKGIGFCRFEYAGHGSDKANYEKADLDIWKAQVLEVMEHIIKEEQILFVGSSIGGWLSFLGAIACPKRTAGIIGLAAAADFSKDLYNYALTDSQKEELEKIGKTSVGTADFSYVFTKNFFTVAEKHFVLNKEIPLDCPVHLLQGMKDACIDPNKAMNTAKALRSSKVTVKMLKNSNHRLQEPDDIKELFNSLDSILADYKKEAA